MSYLNSHLNKSLGYKKKPNFQSVISRPEKVM